MCGKIDTLGGYPRSAKVIIFAMPVPITEKWGHDKGGEKMTELEAVKNDIATYYGGAGYCQFLKFEGMNPVFILEKFYSYLAYYYSQDFKHQLFKEWEDSKNISQHCKKGAEQ